MEATASTLSGIAVPVSAAAAESRHVGPVRVPAAGEARLVVFDLIPVLDLRAGDPFVSVVPPLNVFLDLVLFDGDPPLALILLSLIIGATVVFRFLNAALPRSQIMFGTSKLYK